MISEVLSKIEQKHLRALIDEQGSESQTLDFKKELNTTKYGKFKLAKHIGAFANSSGGDIIVGMDEKRIIENGEKKRASTAHKLVGIESIVNGKPVGEWVHDVIRPHISPEVEFQCHSVKLEGEERIALVIRVYQSSRRPHMVTLNGDYRYYHRTEFASVPAGDYLVRLMYEETQQHRSSFKEFLTERHLWTPNDPEFAQNEFSNKIKNGTQERFMTNDPHIDYTHVPFLTFAATPIWPRNMLDLASQGFVAQLNLYNISQTSQSTIREPLFKYGIQTAQLRGSSRYLVHNPTTVRADAWKQYVLIFRNGHIELCQGARSFDNHSALSPNIFLRLPGTRRLLENFLKFAKDLYAFAKYPDQVSIRIAGHSLRNTSMYGVPTNGNSLPTDENALLESWEINLSSLSDQEILDFSFSIGDCIANIYDVERMDRDPLM